MNGCAEIGKQVPLRMGWIHPCKFKSCHLYMEYVTGYNLNLVRFIINGKDNSLNKIVSHLRLQIKI